MDDCLTLFTTDPEYQRTSVVSTIPPPTLTSNDISYLKKKRTSSNRHTSHVSSTTSHDNLPKPTYSKRKFTHELQMKEKRLDPTLPILKDRIYHHSVHDTQVHPSTLLHPPSLQHQLGGKSMEDRMELNEAIKLTSRLHGEREQELQPQKINQPTTSLKEPNDHDNLSKEIDQSNAPTEKEKEKVSSTSNPSVCITESKRKGSRFTHVPSDYSTLSTTKEVQDTHLSSVSPSVPPLPPSDVLEWYSTPIDASVPTQEEDIKSSDEDVSDSSSHTKVNEEFQCYDQNLAKDIFEFKKSLGSFTSFQLHQARLASNPYDHIDTHPFLNRAALKLAEIDHVFPLMLPPTLSNEVAFLDLACGPGGFTEYLLWKYPEVHGIGTSLPTKDHRDFYPHLFLPSVHVDHRFTYLPGDLCDLEHRSFLLTYLQTHVHEQKVLLVTADGGMDVVGQEHIQEHLHLPLMLAQLHVAFQSLREHGKLVWKIYDVTTPCMMSLLTCVAMHFRSFTLWKPTTSRPANSERYVLADGFLSLPQHYALPNWTSPVSPMTGWIAPPPSLLKFLFRINVRHHQRQYHALVRLKAFLEHPELKHMEPDPREKIEVFLKPFHFPKGLSRKTRKTA